MRKTCLLAAIVVACLLIAASVFATETTGISADEAKAKLIEGNQRFVTEKYANTNVDVERRSELTKGQHPFAVIVSCSDSRVPPEIVFDQGLGDLFVIRTAGDTIDDIAIGSVEYAVEHLGVQLVVVLGHEKCGAVTAAATLDDSHGHQPSYIDAVVKALQPAVDKAKTQKGDLIANAIDDNVDLVVDQLRSAGPILSDFTKKGNIKIIGAVYDLDDGVVSFR
ncbi:MAG TPA: carbonic anhydrase [Methylomusa anaerophila]|uniref:Carbonic anhydrase n=1 Tax=Methylomusa anaerophila TaxID=1930071 RepID=A0A348AFW4_9FIRM|nr:carbonic anhydrase [Methylomusa anaerophila]BBB89962.1 carbonic anhydrase 2 [Methylomusa anaerophila]HML88311.1 carbonic anhydrase [Methylomusa anaerophila]